MGDRTVSEKVGRSQIPYRHHMVRKTIYNPYINIRLHLWWGRTYLNKIYKRVVLLVICNLKCVNRID